MTGEVTEGVTGGQPVATLKSKLDALRVHLEALQPGLIAISGGVDSRLLAHAAQLWNLDYHFVHAVGPHQSSLEQRQTRAMLQALNITPRIIRFDPLGRPEVRNNSRLRCYWCKKALFSIFREMAAAESLRFVLDGTHLDDLAAHRPGQKALQELGVHSPLAQTGLTKADIRQASAWLDLEAPDQPSRACLLTRFPYDRRVTLADLEAVGRVEDGLSALGLSRFRFRITGGEPNLLQVHPDESRFLRDQEGRLRGLIARAGLVPFDIDVTPRLSGYYDSPIKSITHP